MSGKRDSKELKESIDKAEFESLKEQVANVARLEERSDKIEMQLSARIDVIAEGQAELSASINDIKDSFRMMVGMIQELGAKNKPTENPEVEEPLTPEKESVILSKTLLESSFPQRKRAPIIDEKAGRRLSQILENSNDIEKMWDKSGDVQYRENFPSYKHIWLSWITLPEVIKWLKDIDEYHNRHPTCRLPIATLISEKARQRIMNKNGLDDMFAFNRQSLSQMIKYLQRTVRPFDNIEFNKSFKKSFWFFSKAEFDLNERNFVDFYERWQDFDRDCRFVLDFLMESLAPGQDSPPITNKDGGLIQIYLKKIPCEYGDTVWELIKDRKFNNFLSFSNTFRKIIELHLGHAEETLKLGNVLTYKKKRPQKDSTVFQERKAYSNDGQLPGKRLMFLAEEHKYLTEVEAEQLVQYQEDLHTLDTAYAKAGPTEDDLPCGLSDEDAIESIAMGKTAIPSDMDDYALGEQLNALMHEPNKFGPRPSFPSNRGPSAAPGYTDRIMRRPPPSPTDNACFRMLQFKRCAEHEQGKCKYSHEDSVMRTAAKKQVQKMNDLWLDQNGKPSGGGDGRGFPPPPPKQPPPKKPGGSMVNAMFNEETISACRRSMLSYISAESTILKAVLTDAYFVTGDGDILKARTLIDSGATDGSYIDLKFLEKLKDRVPGIIKPFHREITLGDSVTKIQIMEIFEIELFFEYKGQTFRVTEQLRVMPSLGEEIIIGLPTIIVHLLPMFCGMLYDVAEELVAHPESALKYLMENPWTVVEEEAPEDGDTPLPCAFTDHLHYLNITHDEAVLEYHAQFSDEKDGYYRIHPKFRKETDIEKLLRSSKGVDTFVPSNWEGIKGVDPIEFNWKPGMPESMKPLPRPINPRLFEAAMEELRRLCQYMYVPSDSPIASCLVVAPKATKPFIRFCGDYSTLVNKFIITGHYPIPNVFKSIQKICKHRVFLDFDLANSFHQFRLGPNTRSKLSIQTPAGQFEPLFMPEGVPPASGILQKHMENIFAGFEEWTVVIFDNLLVLADSYQDAYSKTEMILDRCRERNLVLKFSKTWLGNDMVEFFGYRCSYNKFELTEKRVNSILDIPFPENTKQMQRFLGCALFFRQFMPNYSVLTARLTDMTEKTFNWNKNTWSVDYELAFTIFKEELIKRTALFYPDYDLPWILRVDACEDGVGFVLLQDPTGTYHSSENTTDPPFQPILFGSKKFSKQARKWDMFNKEAFAMYYAIKECEYMLRGKYFMLQGDHRNLKWIEASNVPKVIRWRIFMQSFSFSFYHIAGKKNIVADWQSRLFSISDINQNQLESGIAEADTREIENFNISQLEMLKRVHGGRSGHLGVHRTFRLLNKYFPGHCISTAQVEEYIRECPECQKVRLGMESALVPIVRHLKNRGPRRVVGIDYLSMEKDKFGNIGLYVTRDHYTKFVFLCPVAEHNAVNAATAIFLHCVYFASFDTLISDPGSDFTSEMISLLNSWFGVHHIFSLVDRHESNGVEGANKQVLRHIKALICDERIRDRWSSPSVIGWVSFIMNKFDDSESGLSPYSLVFGSDVARNLRFPAGSLDAKTAPQFLKQLDKDLETLLEISREYQQKLIAQRVSPTVKQNLYQPGDLVLWRYPDDKPLPSKLEYRYFGPYEVLSHSKNEVECRHLSKGNIKTFYVGELKRYAGTRERAKEIAELDADQYLIEGIFAHRGEPHMRTSMEFFIKFRGEKDPIWRVWDSDLFNSEPYVEYCKSKPSLWHLVNELKVSKQEMVRINNTPITEVKPGDVAFVDLRFYGAEWYRQMNLPDKDFKTYVVEFKYEEFKFRNRKIVAYCEIMDDRFTLDHVFVKEFGYATTFDQTEMVLVDKSFIALYPQLKDRSGNKV